MIDNLILFLVFVLVTSSILDFILLGSWVPFYFRSGFIIFKQEFLFPNPIKPDLKKLETEFSQSRMPPLLFKKIGAYEYAFREKFFHFKFFTFNYTPIMHGLLITNGSAIKVIGILNWFPLIFSIGFIALPLLPFTQTHDEGQKIFRFIPFAMIGILIITLSLIYAIQSYRYKKIGEYFIKTSQQAEKL